MNINYKLLMEKELLSIKNSNALPCLLLHVCCAPCASAVLELLRDYFDITLFFYNPNISPKEEFDFRLDELKKLLQLMNLPDVKIIIPKYNEDEFFSIAKGKETESEGGARCADCYFLRLDKSVAYAEEKKFDYVTTTLSISPHKNATLLNEIGQRLCDGKSVKYLFSDFKKGEGYKRSCTLSKEFNLYRQNYCGCIFSKNAAASR